MCRKIGIVPFRSVPFRSVPIRSVPFRSVNGVNGVNVVNHVNGVNGVNGVNDDDDDVLLFDLLLDAWDVQAYADERSFRVLSESLL